MATTKNTSSKPATQSKAPKGVTAKDMEAAPAVENEQDQHTDELVPAAEEAQEEVNEANEGLDKSLPGWQRQREADKERDNFSPGQRVDDRPARELDKSGKFHRENPDG